MDSWPGPITAITLFVEDLDAARQFYRDAFGLPVHYEDDASAVFAFGNTLINLLKATEAVGLISPAPVAEPSAGARVQFTITVLGHPHRGIPGSRRSYLGNRDVDQPLRAIVIVIPAMLLPSRAAT
jgi:catechol 2,3-dioxygenase-like lactoylglutathione lyase family enzyme